MILKSEVQAALPKPKWTQGFELNERILGTMAFWPFLVVLGWYFAMQCINGIGIKIKLVQYRNKTQIFFKVFMTGLKRWGRKSIESQNNIKKKREYCSRVSRLSVT